MEHHHIYRRICGMSSMINIWGGPRHQSMLSTCMATRFSGLTPCDFRLSQKYYDKPPSLWTCKNTMWQRECPIRQETLLSGAPYNGSQSCTHRRAVKFTTQHLCNLIYAVWSTTAYRCTCAMPTMFNICGRNLLSVYLLHTHIFRSDTV